MSKSPPDILRLSYGIACPLFEKEGEKPFGKLRASKISP